MSDDPEANDRGTDTEHTTDWAVAVVDAIQHLEGYGDPGGEWEERQEFQMKAAHDRLAQLDTSEAPRDAAETIRDVVDGLAETPDVPHDEHGIIGQTALADLAPLAARVARRRASTYGSPEDPTEPLEAVVAARHTLQTISFDDVGDKRCSWLISALEALDNILIDATPEEFAAVGAATRTASDAGPESIDDLPTIRDPTDDERMVARRRYGEEAVPEVGPIPDPTHEHNPHVVVTVPEWALEAARNTLEDCYDADELDRTTVQGVLFEHVQVDERLRTPDGRDAIAALLEEYGGD